MAQPQVRRLDPRRRARDHRILVAPVKRVGLARIEINGTYACEPDPERRHRHDIA